MERREGITIGQPPKYISYEDEVYKVTGISDETEKNGALLYECECKSCGGTHLRNAKHLKQGIRSQECDKYRSWNWTGLDRWDAIVRRTYGIALDDYEKMLEEQGGGCAICGKTEEQEGRRLAIDHCHASEKVRGVLCGKCNQALGMMDDDSERLIKASKYLNSNAR